MRSISTLSNGMLVQTRTGMPKKTASPKQDTVDPKPEAESHKETPKEGPKGK